jgi:hypothetical protein
MSQLLKRFKTRFDSDSIPMANKRELMDRLILITNVMRGLPSDKWKKIDETKVSGRESGNEHKAYFAGKEKTNKKRREKASLAVIATVASKFVYDHTRDLVDHDRYDEFEGVLPVLLRTSMHYFNENAAKLKMVKFYDGNATTEYMESVGSRIKAMVVKASTGSGRGTGESVYEKDVAILLHLLESPIDERLLVVGYDPDDDESSEDEDEEIGGCEEEEEGDHEDDDKDNDGLESGSEEIHALLLLEYMHCYSLSYIYSYCSFFSPLHLLVL